jgi:hypothetical protein
VFPGDLVRPEGFDSPDCLAMFFEFRLGGRPGHILCRGLNGLIDRDLDVCDQAHDRVFRIVGSGAGALCEQR